MQKYNGQLINQFANKVFGNSAAGVLVTVREKETGNLATLYADNDVDGAGLSNPLTSDTVGAFSFYAADGVYTLDFSYSGTPQQVIQLQDVGVLQQQFEYAVLNAGYIPSGAFSAGATLTQANQVLSDGSSYWRWDGSFPKVVSAGSSPTPTGVSNWILISDEALRGDLAAVGSTVLIAGFSAAQLRLVDSIKQLTPTAGIVMDAKGQYGGSWYFDPTANKADHNVVNILSPEAISAWDGTDEDSATLHSWYGYGLGAYRRFSTDRNLYFSWAAPAGCGGLTVGYAIKSMNKAAFDGCSIVIDGSYVYPKVPDGVDGQILAEQYFNKDNIKVSGGKFTREEGSAEYALIFNENYGASVDGVSFIGSSTEFEASKGGISFRDSTDYTVSNCFFSGLGDAWVRVSRAAFTGTLPAPLTAKRARICNNHITSCGQLTTNNTGANDLLISGNIYKDCYSALKVTARNADEQGFTVFTGNIIDGGTFGIEVQGGGNVTISNNKFKNSIRPLHVVPSITGWNPDGSLGAHLGNYNVEFSNNEISVASDTNQALIFINYSVSANQGGFLKISKNKADFSQCLAAVDFVSSFQSEAGSPTAITDPFNEISVCGNEIFGAIRFALNMPVNGLGQRTKFDEMKVLICDNSVESCQSLVNVIAEIASAGGIGGEFKISDNEFKMTGSHEFSANADNKQLSKLEFSGNEILADGISEIFNFWYSSRLTANTTSIKKNNVEISPNCTGVGFRVGAPRSDRTNEATSSLEIYENNFYAPSDYLDAANSTRPIYFNAVTSPQAFVRLVAFDNFSSNRNGRKCRSDVSVYSTTLENIVKQIYPDPRYDVYELKKSFTDFGGGLTRTTVVWSDGSFEVFGTWQNLVTYSYTIPLGLTAKDTNSYSVATVAKNQNCTVKETSRTTAAVAIAFVDAGSTVYPLFDYRISGLVAQSELNSIIGT